MKWEKQQIWRTVSKEMIGGFFCWEVMQVVGDPIVEHPHLYIECRDGSFIVIYCFHFFTAEKAAAFLKDPGFNAVIDIV